MSIDYKTFNSLSKNAVKSLFFNACTDDNNDLIKYLLTSSEMEHNADINDEDDFALRTASRKGNLGLVHYYLTSPDLQKHANIHANDNYCFNIACSMNYVELVKYLLTSPALTKHANLDISGFANACSNGNLDIVKYLLTSPDLKEHIDLYAEDNKAFRWAFENNQYEVLQFLIVDMEMKTDDFLKKYLQFNTDFEVDKIFELAALNQSLKDELIKNNNIHKKLKL